MLLLRSGNFAGSKTASIRRREVRDGPRVGRVQLTVQEEVRAVPTRDESGRSRHEDEVKSLTAQISFLDEEIAVLRRRLADSPRQVRLLEERLRETEGSLTGVTAQNERLAATLREARDQIVALKEEVDRLAQAPSCRRTRTTPVTCSPAAARCG